MVTDPVCLKQLQENQIKDRVIFRGHNYFFCSERCKDVFIGDPDDYVASLAEKAYGDHERIYKEK